MRDARGITRVGAPEGLPASRREKDEDVKILPERYFSRFLCETAKRVNFIFRHSGHNFEAKKFWLELAAFMGTLPSGNPRRA